jgi:hypothetical protein
VIFRGCASSGIVRGFFMAPPRLLSYLITALPKGTAVLRLTGRAIDRPSRDQGVKFGRGLRAALVLQAIVRSDEADCFPAHQFPKGECASHEFPAVAVNIVGMPTQSSENTALLAKK